MTLACPLSDPCHAHLATALTDAFDRLGVRMPFPRNAEIACAVAGVTPAATWQGSQP